MTPNAGDWQCVVVKLMQMQDMINGASYMTPSGSLQRHSLRGAVVLHYPQEKVIQYGRGRKVIEDLSIYPRVIPMYYLLVQTGLPIDARCGTTQGFCVCICKIDCLLSLQLLFGISVPFADMSRKM